MNRWTYATVADFSAYLFGSQQQLVNANNQAAVLRILEAVSGDMENILGRRSFAWGPHYGARVFDLGVGPLRNNVALGGYSTAAPSLFAGAVRGNTLAYEINGYLSIGAAGLIPLDDWLLDDGTQTVSAWTTSDHRLLQILGEGIDADYLLEPYNESPKTTLKLYELTSRLLYAGQQTLEIAGTWGYQNVTVSAGDLGAAITDSTGTAVTLAAGHNVALGHTILVGSEQMYISGLDVNAATVVRGVNGTTAATHSNGATVSTFVHPPDVVQTCLEIARNRWKARDQGNLQVNDQPAIMQHVPGQTSDQLLQTLFENYAHMRSGGGCFF